MCGMALLLALCPLDEAASHNGAVNGGATVAPPSPTRQALMAEATAIAQRRATAVRIDFCYRQTQAVMEGVPLNSGAYGELQSAHAVVLFLQCQVVQESGALLNKRRDPRLSTGQVIDRLASTMGQSEDTHARLVESFITLFE
jgi:hypothetical protein